MTTNDTDDTITVYNTIAHQYVKETLNFAPQEEHIKFSSMLPKKASILDVGCAAGRDSIYFSKLGFDVTGIDLSDELLKIAKSQAPNIRFFKQDMRALNFPKETFDGIWACASLLHLPKKDVPGVLKRFHLLLKPRGVLFLLLKQGKGEKHVAEPLSQNLSRFFSYFEIDELKSLLNSSNFNIDAIYTWNEKQRWPERRDLNWISVFSIKA